MASVSYDHLALERSVRERFGLDVDIRQVIVGNAPVSRTDEATVFLTTKKQLYVYISGQSRMLLSDVKKILSRMGLKGEFFVPPRGQPTYFDDIGRDKFKDVFPGRSTITADDIGFYRTLAPYNPALVQIHEVKNGEIYQFDSDSRGSWRIAAKFAYRRIKTS